MVVIAQLLSWLKNHFASTWHEQSPMFGSFPPINIKRNNSLWLKRWKNLDPSSELQCWEFCHCCHHIVTDLKCGVWVEMSLRDPFLSHRSSFFLFLPGIHHTRSRHQGKDGQEVGKESLSFDWVWVRCQSKVACYLNYASRGGCGAPSLGRWLTDQVMVCMCACVRACTRVLAF